MNADKQKLFRKKLLAWHLKNRRKLPWRFSRNPYRIWLREVILQQTRLEQGAPYFHRFLKRFPDVRQLAQAELDEVLHLWQGLGYYSRARNLHAAARQIVDQLGGRFPKTYQEWMGLKGIGRYTAAAIVSFAFGQPYAVVDGNVCRVLARAFGIRDVPQSAKGKKTFEQLAQALIDPQRPADFNQAMMDLGATVCTPRKPLCSSCFWRHECYAHQHQAVEQFPVRKEAVSPRVRHFAYVLFEMNAHTFITRRGQNDIYSHLYEFPLLEMNRVPDEALVQQRLIAEGWIKAPASPMRLSQPVVHKLTHQWLYVTFVHVGICRHQVHAPSGWRRVAWAELNQFAFPQVIRKYLQKQLS
ncbi:MAG: A/G-specific adenine glycosylase [Chitinophagales bacterium]|nr:A/G-specific adenine glycosylase [Chitinophagales bacterium]MDW8393016.1 A/G-specific adenine glycosylase [Chitinophagales bacterium]